MSASTINVEALSVRTIELWLLGRVTGMLIHSQFAHWHEDTQSSKPQQLYLVHLLQADRLRMPCPLSSYRNL